jgi:hypothetical protein
MSNRFEKLYSLPCSLYAPNSPVIIVAGVLLKDTQTGRVVAQLKLKNISPKTIKAVTISVIPFNIANQPLGKKETHQILDLTVNRDDEFGQKTPHYFSDDTTRAYQVAVEAVFFSDNTAWMSDGSIMSDLPAQKFAAELLSDAELEKQYKLEYGEAASYAADTFSDLWRCKCGAVNRKGEANCHVCGIAKDTALAFDFEQLKTSCQARLEEEREIAEQNLTQRKLHKKKAIKVVAICCILAVAAYFIATVVVPKIELRNELNQAIRFLDDGDYSSAENILDELDDEDFLNATKYKRAISFFEAGKYAQAIVLFERTHNYSDSANYLSESVYLGAEDYFQRGDYLSCISLCESRQIYPDTYYASCYYYAVELKENRDFKEAIEYLEKAGNYSGVEELRYACELGANYEQAISYMETGNLSEAISAFEKLGDFELSSEYIALCKTYEGLCSHWVRVNYIHDKYGKNPPPNITIVTAPQRNGETLYKANGNNAILQGDVLSFCEDKIYKYKFDLSTGVLHLEGVERSYASYKRIDNS